MQRLAPTRRALVSSELARVRAALDAAVVGQGSAKAVLLLGWLARVHVLLEGPPGCGKSALAGALAGATGERCMHLAAHAPLALGSVLHRAREGGVERIRLERARLEAPALLVLDDVAHAPGDLASWLLPRLDRDDGPLVVATRGSREARDPAPPAQALIERLPLRMRMRGVLEAWRERDVRALLERPRSVAREPAALAAGRASALRAQAARLSIPPALLEQASGWLATESFPGAGFARALPRLLRAHALLRGAERVESEDLLGLRQLFSPAMEDGGARDDEPRAGAAAATGSALRSAGEGGGASGDASRAPAPRDRALVGARGGVPVQERNAVESLVAALSGRWERGRGARHADASGAPRRRRPLRDLSESLDADPAELWAYLDGENAEPPAVLQRERRGATPALLVLRDVSASMQGPGARWSLRLVRALVDAARAQRLRVGYLEFNHLAERFTWRDRFVHRAYTALLARAAQASCAGRTSYQAALGAALAARLPRAACDVVLISDGVPVVGDPSVQSERRTARRRGWKLHTVFVGLPPVPPILVELARETSGFAFCVAPRPGSAGAADATWSLQQLAGHSR